MIPLLLAATVSVTFRPAAPTVGDPIAVQFRAPVRLDPSPQYEVVSRQGNTVVVRTFQPRPIALSGVAGDVRFRNLTIPVRSVLQPNDKMEPAPLKPPQPIPFARLPLILIGAAALVAAAIWAAVIALARRRAVASFVAALLPPPQRFRNALLAMRGGPPRWAELADATRDYLAATMPSLGAELTTSQLLQRLTAGRDVVAAVLHQGDYEKFSPWGAPAGNFDALVDEALQLPELFEPREVGEAAA